MQANVGYGKKSAGDVRFRNQSGKAVNPLDQRIEAARVRIEQQGDPIRFLMDVMKGVSINMGPAGKNQQKIWPDLDQRMKAAIILVNKIVPDVKSTEAAGGGDGKGDEDFDSGSLLTRLTRRLVVLAEVTREDRVPGDTVEIGASSPPVPLATVGEGESTPARVRKQRKPVEDVAAPGGTRVRKDKDRGGVGKKSS